MKKLMALVLAFAMVLSLAACGDKTPESTPAPAQTTQAPAQSTASPSGPTTPPETTNPKMDPSLYGGDLNVRFAYTSNTIDPHYGWGLFQNRQWQKCVFETALGEGADGKIYPLICTYEMSADGLTLKLKVRDYYFADGTKVTIEDVASSAQRAACVMQSMRNNFFSHVTSETIEGDTLTYTFDVPGPLYEYQYAYSVVVMKKEINDAHMPEGFQPINKDHVEDYSPVFDPCVIMDESELIGTGPYLLDVYEPDTEIRLKRNPNYVTFENGGSGMGGPKYAYPDTINFLVNLDAGSSAAGTVNGDYDIGSVTADLEEQARAAGCTLNLMHNQWTHAFFFNLSEFNEDSIVQNKDFRKACLYAIDVMQVMLAQWPDDSRFEFEPNAVTANNAVYYNTIFKDKAYNCYDPVKAKEYLEKSGYDGQEEVVWLTNSSGAFHNMTLVAAPMLEAIGIKVKIWQVDNGSHGTYRGDPSNNYDIGCWETQKSTYFPLSSPNLAGTTKANGWRNEKKDEYVKIMQTTPYGSAESVKAWTDLCELIAEEQPYVVYGPNFTGTWTGPRVQDYEHAYEGIDAYYWNIVLDPK